MCAQYVFASRCALMFSLPLSDITFTHQQIIIYTYIISYTYIKL